MRIMFTGDATSWTIINRNKHYSVSRMLLREIPQSVRFMIIVTDPCNVSTREIIKVSRNVTEAIPLMCAAQAPLEMVLSKTLKPTLKKKQLIGKAIRKIQDDRAKTDEIDKNRSNEASSANVDEVDKTNAEIVESKCDKSDAVAKSTEYLWRQSFPVEELSTDSVPLPVGPIAMWQAAMISSSDKMMIEFTSDGSSWNILQRTKHTSVAKMFVRDQPQSVRFMIIVTDPLNLSQREVIKVTREVTETTSLICSPQASLEMVLMKPLVPRPKKKPLIGQTHANRANVGNIDKPNTEIVALRDDRSDIAEGTESQIHDVAKIERDKASEAKTDAVAENNNGEVPEECDSKADVEQSPEAPEQRQPQQLSSTTVGAPDRDAAECVQQRTAEQVIDVPDDAGMSWIERRAFFSQWR